jgi:tRNA pseudouridine55 synthase
MQETLLKEKTASVDGLLLVDKPAGISSHDVVAVARRAIGEKRIGHAGTLDPFATGLLVLLVGRATRLAAYLPAEPKEYEALVRFGTETNTEDADGEVSREAALPTAEALEVARAGFVGTIAQVPPAFSAKHVDGQRAYKLAPVQVTIHSLALSAFERTPDGAVTSCRMQVSCGGGTYVRSLARDLARAAGSAAHLETLRRHRAGVFTLARSIPYERMRDGSQPVTIAPPMDALEGMPVQVIDTAELSGVLHGADLAARVPGTHAALIEAAGGGALVALAERVSSATGDRWQPRVVMRDA